MSDYDNYITRLCRTGKHTAEQAREFALSKEVEKYYQEAESERMETINSTYEPMGECV